MPLMMFNFLKAIVKYFIKHRLLNALLTLISCSLVLLNKDVGNILQALSSRRGISIANGNKIIFTLMRV